MAMKKSTKKMQPSPPKRPSYTAKDSAAWVATDKRLQTNIEKYKKMPKVKAGGNTSALGQNQNDPIELKIRRQADTLMRNPYNATANDRFSKGQPFNQPPKGMKGIKSAPKKGMTTAKPKMTKKKKN